ncbi:MAG TPA: glycosyltransferase family 4 protein [Thermoanaerobaculia bacterium]|nr:glycosyltransferase family 4 protein [Thermoanaerobaculia bacterium]
MTPARKPRSTVGYVLRKFPVLSETFILNEILALEGLGVALHVFALATPRDPRFHEGIARLKAEISYLPDIVDWRVLLRQNRQLARRHPRRYRRELLSVLRRRDRWLLWRFLQAGYVADRARRYDVGCLHAHFANRATTVAYYAARLSKIPFSFTAHAFDIFGDHDFRVLAKKMRAARFVATVSRHNVGYLASQVKGDGARIELIRNGIDLEHFAPPAAPPPAVPFTILAVARLIEKKGLDVLVAACGHLRDRGHLFRCRIVGKGILRAELKQLIQRLDLGDRVELVGPHTQNEIVARYHQAHVLTLPCVVAEDGNRDGLPVSIVEALACGVPVVATAVTGIPEAVTHGVNGLIVPERDPVALADALESLLLDRDRLAALRQAARPSVVEMFDARLTTLRLRDLLLGEGDAGERADPRVRDETHPPVDAISGVAG